MGCSRRRLSNNDRSQPGGRKLSTRSMSTVPSHETPRRCLRESMSRSRWLSTGQTGTQEPHMTHSSVKRATCGAISSEIVARLRSAMLTMEDMGTGQARMQRSQPMHMSISKRTSSSLRGRKFVRCSIPTTRLLAFCLFDGCMCILAPSLPGTRKGCHYIFQRGATICAEACDRCVHRAAFVTGVRLRDLSAGRPVFYFLLIDKVDGDAAYGDTVTVGQAIGIIDSGTVHHDAIAAAMVANIDTIRTREDLGMEARGGDIGQDNVIILISSKFQALASLQAEDLRFTLRDHDKHRRFFEGRDNSSGDGAARTREQERAIGVENRLPGRQGGWACSCGVIETRHGLVQHCLDLPGKTTELECIGYFAKKNAIILLENMHTASFQALVIDECAIGTTQITQYVLSISIAHLRMTARDRPVIDEQVDARLATYSHDPGLAQAHLLQTQAWLVLSHRHKKCFGSRLRREYCCTRDSHQWGIGKG